MTRDPSSEPILVVESDSRLGRSIAEQLSAHGYQTELARTAEQARILAVSKASRPRRARLTAWRSRATG
jgi:DNA-binding response OmpR family regulator